MFWETLAAIFLLLTTMPLWIVAGVAWGLIKAAITFAAMAYGVASSPYPDGEALLTIPLLAIVEGFKAAWSIPSGMWVWAKFEHPWWATALGFVAMMVMGGSGRR